MIKIILGKLFILLLMGSSISVFGQSADSSKGELIVQVFGNAFVSDMTSDHSHSGFQIGRAHLGYAYRFDNRFSSKIILDRGRPSTVQAITVQDSAGNDLDVNRGDSEGSYYSMTLKFASLEWRANERLKLQIGAVLQNHYIPQERFWGYRYVAPTFQNRYFHTPSGDLGLIAFYQLNDRSGYDLAVYNGEGFRKSQDDEGNLQEVLTGRLSRDSPPASITIFSKPRRERNSNLSSCIPSIAATTCHPVCVSDLSGMI